MFNSPVDRDEDTTRLIPRLASITIITMIKNISVLIIQ